MTRFLRRLFRLDTPAYKQAPEPQHVHISPATAWRLREVYLANLNALAEYEPHHPNDRSRP